MKALLTSLALALLSFGAFCQNTAADVTLWSIEDGVANGGYGASVVADPFGTGQGDIMEIVTDGTSQWTNFNPGAFDSTVHAGQTYTFSFDIYVPQTAIDAGIDHNIYYAIPRPASGIATDPQDGNPGDFTGLFTDVQTYAGDQWHTVSFDRDVGVGHIADNFLFLRNHKGTTETAPAYYLDNFLLTVSVPEPASCSLIGLALGAVMIRRRRR